MEFGEFADRAAAVETESADDAIRERVTDLLCDAGEDLARVSRFVQGRVFPAHDSTTLDIGPALCHEAIARAAGPNVTAAAVEGRLADVGEIGDVAASYDFGGQRGLSAFVDENGGDSGTGADPLTVAEVDRTLRAVADAEGEGSEDTKLDLLFGLFNRAGTEEARYLARLVLAEMRIGVGGGTARDAIAAAFDAPVERVERALQVSNDYGLVAETARDAGVAGLDDIRLEVGRPVQAMLAGTGTASEAIEAWGEAAVDWKFDGARVQAHHDGDVTELFSRNMEAVTGALPEVVEAVADGLAVPAILDGEVVAVDADGDPLPFQSVLRRFRRKHDIERAREEVALEFHAFDCLYAAGEDLLDAPLVERHDRLAAVFDGQVAELSIEDDPDAVAAIETDALDAGHEGILLKRPDSTYSPGRRGRNWLKRKPDVETLDLVVTGAEWGEGRRADELGTFLLSARAGDGYETIGKVATGITDEQLTELTDRLGPHIRSESGTEVDIEPTVVFEVGYEEIQRSPTYGSGYALRFPRFRAVREDKDPADADTVERVERLAEDR